MAVPGADRRESTDGRRTDGVDSATPRCPGSGGLPTTLGSDGSNQSIGARASGLGPFADNTGKHEVQVLSEITETDDGFATEPPAIEVVTGPTAVAELSSGTPDRRAGPDGDLGENGIYLHCLDPAPDAYRRATTVETRNERHPNGIATVVGPRKTVITK